MRFEPGSPTSQANMITEPRQLATNTLVARSDRVLALALSFLWVLQTLIQTIHTEH